MTTPTMKGAFASRAVDPAHLESLGKTAARLADNGDVSLTDAVVQTIGREKLNSEQVRRVVEHANVEAFNRKFASTSGHLRAVHIDGGPADPAAVLQSLNNAARPREVTIDALEYSMSPEDFSKSSSLVSSTVDRTTGGLLGEISDLQHQLRAAHDEMVQSVESSKSAMIDALNALGRETLSASRQGASPEELFSAWHSVSPELAKTAFARMRPLMRHSGVKVAGRVLNPAHPVVRNFESFVKAASSYGAHQEALTSIEAEIVKVSQWLKSRRSVA